MAMKTASAAQPGCRRDIVTDHFSLRFRSTLHVPCPCPAGGQPLFIPISVSWGLRTCIQLEVPRRQGRHHLRAIQHYRVERQEEQKEEDEYAKSMNTYLLSIDDLNSTLLTKCVANTNGQGRCHLGFLSEHHYSLSTLVSVNRKCNYNLAYFLSLLTPVGAQG